MVKFFYKWLILLLSFCFAPYHYSQETGEEPVDTIPEYVKIYEKASSLIDSGRYREAIPELKKVLKENPDFYMAHNKMALIFIKTEKHKDAIKSLAKAEEISPVNYETQKLRGISFYLTNKFSQSKTAIDSAVAIAHDDKIDDPELFYYQALLMYKGKSYKTALAACVAALELQPKYLEVLILKCEIRFATKDYLNAIKDADEAIKAMPAEKQDYNCYKLRAKSKFEVRDFNGAVKDWSIILDADAEDEEAYVSRAAAKINLRDNSGAIADLDEAIKLNGKNAVSYCYRGIAKGENKQYVEAIKDLDAAIKIKFNYAEAYFRRGVIKFASKDKQGACDDLNKADSLGDPTAFKLVDQYCKTR